MSGRTCGLPNAKIAKIQKRALAVTTQLLGEETHGLTMETQILSNGDTISIMRMKFQMQTMMDLMALIFATALLIQSVP